MGKYGPFKGKFNKSTETVPEEAHTLHLLLKDFKPTVLNILKELKETMEKN